MRNNCLNYTFKLQVNCHSQIKSPGSPSIVCPEGNTHTLQYTHTAHCMQPFPSFICSISVTWPLHFALLLHSDSGVQLSFLKYAGSFALLISFCTLPIALDITSCSRLHCGILYYISCSALCCIRDLIHAKNWRTVVKERVVYCSDRSQCRVSVRLEEF